MSLAITVVNTHELCLSYIAIASKISAMCSLSSVPEVENHCSF